MKIIFLCGSLEPGRDGVGDYTRMLGGELVRKGHQIFIIAVRDQFVPQPLAEDQKSADGTSINVLRMPATFEINECFRRLKLKIRDFNPDWISLQFVPFSFHPKGLPITLGPKLKSLIQGRNLQIMFHELWVSTGFKKNLKMGLLGSLQKTIIKRLINQLKPQCITTSIPAYRERLSGLDVRILPLFGNIPVVPVGNAGLNGHSHLKIVHFGSFTGAFEEFKLQLRFVVKAAEFYNRRIEFIIFGEGGVFKDQAVSVINKLLAGHKVTDLGRLSVGEISRTLQTADMGISRAGADMYGKSGSTLAMIEHGIPVVLRGKKESWDNGSLSKPANYRQFLFSDSDLSGIIQKWPARNSLDNTADLFINILNGCEEPDLSGCS